MKVAAHPLVVAVALGLVGPSALEGLQSRGPEAQAATTLDISELDAPDAEDIAKAAEAFQAARERI